MTIVHHPDVASLMSCAAGSQPEALAAIMASHVSMCPACARELATMELIGSTLFEDLPAAPFTREAPVLAARAAEAGPDRAEGSHQACSTGEIPAPLAALLGSSLDDIAWKRLAPGVWQYSIPLSKSARGSLRLVKVAPGVKIPEHGHGGEELTLLLRGSYHDKLGTYRRGDVADLDVDVEHEPIADAKEGCICLVASDTKARFKGLLARILQPLTGM